MCRVTHRPASRTITSHLSSGRLKSDRCEGHGLCDPARTRPYILLYPDWLEQVDPYTVTGLTLWAVIHSLEYLRICLCVTHPVTAVIKGAVS